MMGETTNDILAFEMMYVKQKNRIVLWFEFPGDEGLLNYKKRLNIFRGNFGSN